MMDEIRADEAPRLPRTLRALRDTVPPLSLVASTGCVAAGGVAAVVVMATLAETTLDSDLLAVLLLQCAGLAAFVAFRSRTVALAGVGMASAGPFVLPQAAPPALLLATCLVPLLGAFLLEPPVHRVASLASYGWILPVMHETFGYAGLGYSVPLLVVLAATAFALARLPRPAWPPAAAYLAIVLFLGYA